MERFGLLCILKQGVSELVDDEGQDVAPNFFIQIELLVYGMI